MTRKFYRFLVCACFLIALAACHRSNELDRSSYVPVHELEPTFGPLIAVGNQPTPDQHGTGERIGFFQDAEGTIWGLPINLASDGSVLVCGPADLRDAAVTDRMPAGSNVIGTVNAPTGWRGGTGSLELLLRVPGGIHAQQITGARFSNGSPCWNSEPAASSPQLHYYRIVAVVESVAVKPLQLQ